MLVNGQFIASEGIRQGDPLSSCLFTIVAEAFVALLVWATVLGLFKGFEARHNGEVISDLQFADDTVLFCSTTRGEVLVLKRVLRCF